MITPFFFRFNQSRFNQYFYMVGYRGLGEVNNFLDACTLSATAFIGDIIQNFQAVTIPKGFRNFFDLFDAQFQFNTLMDANVSIIYNLPKIISPQQRTIVPNEQKYFYRSF